MKTPNALFYKIEIIEPDDKELFLVGEIKDLQDQARNFAMGEDKDLKLRDIYEAIKEKKEQVWTYSYSRLKGRKMEYWPLYSYEWVDGAYYFNKILPSEYKNAINVGQQNVFCLGPDEVKIINSYKNAEWLFNYLGQTLDKLSSGE